MASVSSADRTGPDRSILPAPLDEINMDLGTPFAACPKKGFSHDAGQVTATLVSGGVAIRITVEFPETILTDRDNRWYMFLGWIGANIAIYPMGIAYSTTGLAGATVDTGISFPDDAIGYQPNTKYVFEFQAIDDNSMTMTVWADCGGAPLGSCQLDTIGNFATPQNIYIGWPPEDIYAGFKVLCSVGPELHTPNTTNSPYMIKFHSVTLGNVGPAGATFTQQTALSQAADQPAGTYVGYFDITHSLGSEEAKWSYATLNPGNPQWLLDEYEIKRNKLYTKVRGSLLSVTNTGFDLDIVDRFNVLVEELNTGVLGPLVVTA